MFFFFSFYIYVEDGYGKRFLDSYCGLDEGEFLIILNLNIFVEVRVMNKYDIFIVWYVIFSSSIDNGKKF